MANLATRYLGLDLASPILAASSPFTGSVESIKRLELAGIGAVVLRSIFEEQIRADVAGMASSFDVQQHAEVYDYIRADLPMQLGPERYLQLIRDAKQAVGVPVIASINCLEPDQWTAFARKVEVAGADALELNVYDIPTGPALTGAALEARHLALVRSVCERVRIPVAVKIGPQYSSIPHMVQQLAASGAKGVVLFNRFYQPQIDLETQALKRGMNLSRSSDAGLVIRWLAILRNHVDCDLSMTTGVHTAEDVLRGVLAGATTVQICSALYGQSRFGVIGEMHAGIRAWLEQKQYESLSDARGTLSEPAEHADRGFARAQYVSTLVEAAESQ